MKPAPFDYRDPVTLDEALALLAEHGDDAAVLAGGQSLVPLLNLRLARPAVIVDVRRIPDLDTIEVTADAVRLGARVRASVLETDRQVAAAIPCLPQALREVGHLQIRHRTTIGGNIAHADPASELPAVLLALDGTVTLRSAARGERTVTAHDFFYGAFWTTREPDEIVTAVAFPVFQGGSVFLEMARRRGDFAIVGTCLAVAVAEGVVTDARIALAGCGGRPVRAPTAEQALAEGGLTSDAAAAAGRLAGGDVAPPSDAHGSAEYRKALAAALVERGLRSMLPEVAR